MEGNSVSNELSLNEVAKAHLHTTRKWVYAISIIGLIAAIYLIGSSIYTYITLSRWDDVPSGGGVGYLMAMAFGYIFFGAGVFCFIPFYYLYKFSSYLKMALDVDDAELLETSFRYLKLHYKSIGVLLLIFIVIYFSISRIF